MTDEERKAMVSELKQLAKAIEAGRNIADEKPLIRSIASRLLTEAKAPAMARNIALGYFK